jgi:hypothetical protein
MPRLCTAAALSFALIGSANAGVNIEYGEVYEEAYLQICSRDNPMRACTCSMEALEEKVGFTRFAEEVDSHRDDFLKQSDLAVMASDLVAKCEAGLHASE